MLGEALRSPLGSEHREELMRRVASRGERVAFVQSVEVLVAPDLLQELLLRTAAARRQAVRTASRYQLLGLAEHLIARARGEVFEDVARAAELGSLALEVSEGLSPQVYGGREVATVQARAWSALGNALRVRSELREADRALSSSRELLERGHGAATDRADYLSLLGSLRMSQARYEEARRVLEEAAGLYGQQGEAESQAKVLIKLGKALEEAGAPNEAVPLLERAEQILREDGTELFLYARQVRATCLNESGRAGEARELLEALRPEWMARFSSFSHHQRLRWLDARISRGEGDLAAAERKFLVVQAGFEEREEAYDYALVSLEIAALYLEQGRTAEVRELAERMLPIFQSQDIHRHAMAALVLVQRAVASDTVTVTLLHEVGQYLRRARSNPELVYSPAS